MDFYVSNSLDNNWLSSTIQKGLEPIHDNEIRRSVNIIVGEQSNKNERVSVRFNPRVNPTAQEQFLIEDLQSKIDEVQKSSKISKTILDTLRMGLITGLSFVEIVIDNNGFTTNAIPCAYPIGIMPFNEICERYDGTKGIFHAKIVQTSELLERFKGKEEILFVIDQNKGKNLGTSEANSNYTAQNYSASNIIDDTFIRIIELWQMDSVTLFIPESRRCISGSSEKTYTNKDQFYDENLHLKEQKKNPYGIVPYISYVPEFNPTKIDVLEHRYFSPINSAKSLQESLNKVYTDIINKVATNFSNTVVVNESALMNRKDVDTFRSEERRVGKECRYRWSPYHEKKKKNT